jgi:hypothetical protein
MATGLIDIVKRAALDAINASNPTDLRYGTVTKTSPLEITVTSTFVLPEKILIVPQHLTDYEVPITTSGYGWVTDSADGHTHGINQSRKTVMVHNALKVGDRVALIREHGGRKFFVLDRF